MRRALVFIVVLAAVSVLPEKTVAQTLYGQSGLFIHPTAFTPKRNTITLSASEFTQREQGQRQTEWVSLGLGYALTDRFEFGVLYVDRLGPTGNRRGSAGVFTRYQLLKDTESRPAIALSGSYLGSDVRLATVSAVASYPFRHNGRTLVIGHTGVQWGWRADGVPDSDSVSAFVGAEVPLGREFYLVGEYGSRFGFDAKERSAVGVMWRGRGYSLALGYVNVGRSSDNHFLIGVGFPLGGNK